MRKQRIVLKDHANTPAFWLHPCPFPSHGALGQLHRAPLGAFKASNQAKQGGFTATGGAEQTQQLPLRHLKIDPLKGPALGSIAVAVPDTVQLNRRLHREQLFHRSKQLGNGQSL